MESPLRDVAFLLILALLFVLTLQILWLTGGQRRHRVAAAERGLEDEASRTGDIP